MPAGVPHAARADLFRVSLTITLPVATAELPADTGFRLCSSRSHAACVSNRRIRQELSLTKLSVLHFPDRLTPFPSPAALLSLKPRPSSPWGTMALALHSP